MSKTAGQRDFREGQGGSIGSPTRARTYMRAHVHTHGCKPSNPPCARWCRWFQVVQNHRPEWSRPTTSREVERPDRDTVPPPFLVIAPTAGPCSP
jgi:hypothetical protein